MKFEIKAILCVLVLLISAPVFAEKWALLIGINDYEDRNYIASLGAADNDARKLKEVLKSKMGFPDANIDLLVSDGDNKPTRSNIILALGKLAENAKSGDTVFVFYSGHGTEINGITYLLPHDFKGRNQFTGTETALAVIKFQELLKQVKAKALIMAWDMCRNDPFAKGKSGDAARAKLGNPKAWQIVPDKTRSADSPVIATLYACSPGQSSFEWQDKNRGYFAWFLEEGMRGAAVDANGNITLGSLADYVHDQVSAQTKASEPAEQTPVSEMIGASPHDFVLLSTGKPIADASTTKSTVGNVKPISTRAKLVFKDAPKDASIKVGQASVKGFTWDTDLLEPSQEVVVTITAPGYRPQQLNVTLEKGATLNITIKLEKVEEAEPDPVPDPANNTNLPPPQIGNAGEAVKRITQAHNVPGLFQLPAIQLVGTGQEKADVLGNLERYQQLLLVEHPASNRFRMEFTTTTSKKAIRAGFDGAKMWKFDPGPDPQITIGQMYNFNPSQMLWYVLRALPTLQLGKIKKDKNNITIAATDSKMQGARFVFTVTPESLIQRIQLFLGDEEMSFSYDKYQPLQNVPIPTAFRFAASKGAVRGTQYIYTYDQLKISSYNNDDYFKGGS